MGGRVAGKAACKYTFGAGEKFKPCPSPARSKSLPSECEHLQKRCFRWDIFIARNIFVEVLDCCICSPRVSDDGSDSCSVMRAHHFTPGCHWRSVVRDLQV